MTLLRHSIRPTRWLLLLPLTALLASCGGGSQTGFLVEIYPPLTAQVPSDFDQILVQVQPDDAAVQGNSVSVTNLENPPYNILVLQGKTKYKTANTITVTLEKGGMNFARLTEGPTPFNQGELTPVNFDFNR